MSDDTMHEAVNHIIGEVYRMNPGVMTEVLIKVMCLDSYRADMERAANMCEEMAGDRSWIHPEHQACADAIREAAK